MSSDAAGGLVALIDERLATLSERAPATTALLAAHPALAAAARRVLLASEFAGAAMLSDDALLPALWESGDLARARAARRTSSAQ